MARTIVTIGTRLDTGLQRSINEDNLSCQPAANDEEARDFGHLFVLADGMGGHAAGEVASRLAVDTIVSTYSSQKTDDIAKGLLEAIEEANRVIHEAAGEDRDLAGMGTTCVAGVIHGDDLYMAHVGDSRAYLLRNSVLTQITADHSWVEEQVRRGLLTAEEARNHPMRNVITRALGSDSEVKIDVSVRKIEEGDVLLICSDGLSAPVEDEAIREVLAASQTKPQAAADALVALANAAGGPDNIGVIVARIDEVVPIPASSIRDKLRSVLKKGLNGRM